MRKLRCTLVFFALIAGCSSKEAPHSVAARIKSDSAFRRLQFDSLPNGLGAIRIDEHAHVTVGDASENDNLEFDSRAIRLDVAELPSGDFSSPIINGSSTSMPTGSCCASPVAPAAGPVSSARFASFVRSVTPRSLSSMTMGAGRSGHPPASIWVPMLARGSFLRMHVPRME